MIIRQVSNGNSDELLKKKSECQALIQLYKDEQSKNKNNLFIE
jgi:hypothetical protein